MRLDRAKEILRSRLNILDVIGEYVGLRQAGKNYIGLCPFHNEKSPSFTVSPERQLFHCFGCKKGGDIITFWMSYHNMGYMEAINDLARKYKVPVAIFENGHQGQKGLDEYGLLKATNERAMKFFAKKLRENREPLEYLMARGLPREIIQQFSLGYATEEWKALSNHLKEQGLEEAGLRAGLLAKGKDGEYYDRFRDRIMFPLYDTRGDVVGFGGRTVHGGNREPKYLNTPETRLFQKRRYLYGLYQALSHIRNTGRAIVVEGYMDALALRARNINEVVATLGTSLTQEHMKVIRNWAKELLVVFDGDSSGRKASLRILPLALNENMLVKIVSLPEGHDPDTFLKEFGVERFLAYLESARHILDYYLAESMAIAGSRDELILIAKELVPILNLIESPLLRAEYVKRLADTLGLSERHVLETLSLSQPKGEVEPGKGEEVSFGSNRESLREMEVLNFFLNNPAYLPKMRVELFDFLNLSGATISLLLKMRDAMESGGREGLEITMDSLQRENELLREVMLMPPLFKGKKVEEAFRDILARAEAKKISQEMEEAKKKGDLTRLSMLIKEKASLVIPQTKDL